MSRPVVILLTDAYRGANKPEPGVALVNHCVSVAKIFPNNLAIHNLLWDATVTSCRRVKKNSPLAFVPAHCYFSLSIYGFLFHNRTFPMKEKINYLDCGICDI